MNKYCIYVRIEITFDIATIGKEISQIPGKNEIENICSLIFDFIDDPFDIVVYLKESNGTSIVNIINRQIQHITGVKNVTSALMIDIPIE